jgi:polyhydroxybutyrate depolymerase
MGDQPGDRREVGPRRARKFVLGLLAPLVLITVMASGSLGAAAATVTPATSDNPPTTSAGCGSGGSTAGGTLNLTVDGRSRVVIVHLPVGYHPSGSVALVLNMHGSGSTAAEQEAFTGMDATADANDFIVAYPQALIPDRTGFDWNVPGQPLVGGRKVPKSAPNDVSFLTSLVGMLEQRYCINQQRVYATGFSGGARTASQLACNSSAIFAAVAPVSGLRSPKPCPDARPVPIVSFHGLADPVDPYMGHGEAYWTYSVPQAAKNWAKSQGCAPKAAPSVPATGVILSTYSGCNQGSRVELYSISGEGHEWPGGPPLPKAITRTLGPQSNAIDANTVMWDFFVQHPL